MKALVEENTCIIKELLSSLSEFFQLVLIRRTPVLFPSSSLHVRVVDSPGERTVNPGESLLPTPG
ncbi:MAG TPA: hypothetical protein VKV19_03875 [Ktedonobacteraceae bacterium]|nr:hypothetical protein [Ktedonobacteraceae bacterium]